MKSVVADDGTERASRGAMRRVLPCVLLLLVSVVAACDGRVDARPPGGGYGDGGLGNPGDTSDAGAGSPDGGGASTALFRDIFLPVGGLDLALDDEAIYVFDDIGQVTRVDKATGAKQSLVRQPALGAHRAMTLCNDSVFWTDTGEANGRILSVPKTGGEVQIFKDGLHWPWGIACDATTLYWTEEGTQQSNLFDGVVASAPLAGGDRVVLTNHEGWMTPTVAVTDDAVIFGSELTSGVEIRRIAKTGGEVTTLSTVPGRTDDIDIDIEIEGDYVVWTASTGAFYAPLAGGTAVKVGDWPTQNLALTGQHLVYETAEPRTPYDVTIMRAPFGGAPTALGRTSNTGGFRAAISDASGAYLMDVRPAYGTTIHVVAR